MDLKVITYLVYLAISVALTVWVAQTLFRNGRVFLIDVFRDEALADSVKEVFDLDPSRIEPPPRIGASLRTEFIRGMGRKAEGFFIILDINRVFSLEELCALGGEVDGIAGSGAESVPVEDQV